MEQSIFSGSGWELQPFTQVQRAEVHEVSFATSTLLFPATPRGPDPGWPQVMESRREGRGVCLWWEEPRGAVCTAALALPTEIYSRANTGAADSQVFFPQEELDPLWSCRHRKAPGEAGSCDSHQPCHRLLAWAPLTVCPKAVTAFVMAGTSHTQELLMHQRSTSPKLAVKTELCAGDINTAISTLTWSPAHCPRLLAILSKTIPGRMPSKRNPKITHTTRMLQSLHLLNELPPSTWRGNQHRVSIAVNQTSRLFSVGLVWFTFCTPGVRMRNRSQSIVRTASG